MKKTAILILAASLIFSLCACGSSGSSTENNAKTTHGDKELYIGGIGPTTGAYANYGLSVQHGAEVAVKEINETGGIGGMTITFSMQDSQGDPEAAVSAYGKLLDWGMDVSIGTVLSGEMASVVNASANDDMFMITASASADACLEASKNAFRICFYDSYQGIAAADYVNQNLPGKAVSVFYQSDNDYSVGLYESFEARCKELGITFKTVQTFLKSDTDYTAQINALADSGAEIIFIPIYAEETSTFLTQAKNGTADAIFGENTYFFGADGLDGIMGKVSDPKDANNVLMLTPFAENSTDEKVKNFVSKYQAAYGSTPDQFAADGYDAIYVLKEVIEKAGYTASSQISGAKLSSTITTLSYKGVTGEMKWKENGNTDKGCTAIIYKDGAGSVFGE